LVDGHLFINFYCTVYYALYFYLNITILYVVMFWTGRVNVFNQLHSYWKGDEVTLSTLREPNFDGAKNAVCEIRPASLADAQGIAKLLNESFEPPKSKAKMAITTEWVRESFGNGTLWVVAKDPLGTVRGCISSSRISAPYPTHLGSTSCSMALREWGIMDWYCVHPLWREKGVGSDLLEAIDFITYTIGRKAHVFIKEGLPLLQPQIPIYSTFLKVRKAGNPQVKQMREGTGLLVFPYMCNDSQGVPLVRLEGIVTGSTQDIHEWEAALDNDLPECWAFVSGVNKTLDARWKQDSLVSVYAFRWNAGKWLGKPPNSEII
jgi:GNAT superfamily N-acetyltransferase